MNYDEFLAATGMNNNQLAARCYQCYRRGWDECRATIIAHCNAKADSAGSVDDELAWAFLAESIQRVGIDQSGLNLTH
jgi:hypothetical protein